MVNFLFWNLNRKDLGALVSAACEEHQVDVLMLAESVSSAIDLLGRLNAQSVGYHLTSPESGKVQILTRFDPRYVIPSYDDSRMTVKRLCLPARQEILLAVVHLQSKWTTSAESQAMQCSQAGEVIRQQERITGHQRTIVVGDFNMDPFESGMVAAAGFHGVMTRAIAAGDSRIVDGREYPFFYNPMWSHFGDLHGGSPGTHYYSAGGQVSYFWHMFDQVLLRPQLASGFQSSGLQILESIQGAPLVTASGRPKASDHLPVLFKLNF